ncbi:MAG: hypothetical protein MUE40_10150 [Anaerolineae bacterium]|nr:hypothetical protein [Anaerolineae bacterium]
MSYRDNRAQRRSLLVIGIILISSMVLSLVLPLFQNNLQQQAILPTPTIAPTVPAPIASLESISFTDETLHPSGLFTAGIPTGWSVSTTSLTDNEAQLTLQNPAQLSVAEVRVIRPAQPLTDIAEAGSIFTEAWIRQSWNQYRNPTESVRSIEGDRMIIDFTMDRSNQNYIARQIATTDGTFVYVSRVVAPPNAAAMVQYVVNGLADSVALLPDMAAEPFGWNAHFDTSTRYLIRYPRTWQLVDSAPGQPASIESPTSVLRVDVVAGSVADADAASARVAALRAGLTVLSAVPVERDGVTGFQVSYRLTTLDGDSESGAAVLLNGSADRLYIASLRLLDVPDADLNAADAATTQPDAVNVLNSFTLLPDLEAVPATPPAPVPAA